MKLALLKGILPKLADFGGSLVPVLFPEKEFKPKRLAAVVVTIGVIGGAVHFLGAENTEIVLDLVDDALDLMEGTK